MVNDRILKWLFIPLLGLLIPYSTRFFLPFTVDLRTQPLPLIYFLLAAALIWMGSVYLMLQVRHQVPSHLVLKKIGRVFLVTGIFSFLAVGAFNLIWQFVFLGGMYLFPLLTSTALALAMVWIFSLLYEIIFLSNERVIDERVVEELDRELLGAEVNLLKNELDPHFVYNTLVPLYYLVKNDRATAEQFACKLIQVYQYFLQNRSNDFITLGEEVKFIENYIYLLQIRYKNNITVSFSHLDQARWQMVLPFSLQLLVENAIKHNYFDQENPLSIRIAVEKGYLVVSNSKKLQEVPEFSSSIGLKNLRTRYRILCNQHIHVLESTEQFIVKLPMNQSLKMNDHNYNHRRRSN